RDHPRACRGARRPGRLEGARRGARRALPRAHRGPVLHRARGADVPRGGARGRAHAGPRQLLRRRRHRRAMTVVRRAADRWRRGWEGAGGGGEVLRFATLLILSQMTFTLQTTIDRVFLTWYAPEAVAAATASVFVTIVPILACAGTGEYVT